MVEKASEVMESKSSSSQSEIGSAEDVVQALLDYLVAPMLPLKSAGREVPSLEQQQSVAKQPQTKNGVDSFGGLGATLIDSLDTLYIMGLNEQFQRAREWVANSLDCNKNYDASVFETTIRVVGGLLSTYDLSGDKIFLEKAKDIADRLLPAWDTQSGIPYNIINLAHGNAHNPGWTGFNRYDKISGRSRGFGDPLSVVEPRSRHSKNKICVALLYRFC